VEVGFSHGRDHLDLSVQAFRDQLLAAGLSEERVHFVAWLCCPIVDGTPYNDVGISAVHS
jgi:type VI protein secretion system component VasF